jgi:hypothetical protein
MERSESRLRWDRRKWEGVQIVYKKMDSIVPIYGALWDRQKPVRRKGVRRSCDRGEDEESDGLSMTPESTWDVRVLWRSRRRTGRICAPVPKRYKPHGDLSKHVRRYHLHRLVLKCRGQDIVFDTLKGCKYHQKNAPDSANAAAPPSPCQTSRTFMWGLPVLHRLMPWPRSTSTITALLPPMPESLRRPHIRQTISDFIKSLSQQ